MAKVIHTPVIGRGARRALPVERTVEPTAPTDDEHGATAAPAPQPTAIDAREARRIVSERDAALQRAETAEANMAQMKQDLDALRKQAHQHGLEAGMEQARRSVSEQRDAETEQRRAEAEQFQRLCDELLEQQKQRVAQAEEAAVEIGFAATLKLLGRLHSDNALLEALVRQSMEQVLAREGLKIYLSPKDCRRMQALARRGSQDWAGVEFEADSRIQMGGCRIESRAGSLDARLELQVDELRKALLRAVQPDQPAGKDRG